MKTKYALGLQMENQLLALMFVGVLPLQAQGQCQFHTQTQRLRKI